MCRGGPVFISVFDSLGRAATIKFFPTLPLFPLPHGTQTDRQTLGYSIKDFGATASDDHTVPPPIPMLDLVK